LDKKPISVAMPVLLAPVFSRLAVFVCAKTAIRPWFKKKFQPNRSEGKKVTAVSKWALKITSGGSADMDQTAAKIT